MNQVIPYASLASCLGFEPKPGSTQMVSPDGVDAHIRSHVRLDDDGLFIQTRDDNPTTPDMLRLALIAQPDGWHIQEQVHSGLSVNPDAKLALSAIEQNLSATPLVVPARRLPRP